jgi:uncharacterized protein (UPF0212 family)
MRAPSPTDLLLAWERGLDQSPTGRALELLLAAMPQATLDSLSTLPIGKRDRHLLNLRQLLFGNDVAALSQCPECGDKLDVTFDVNDVRLGEYRWEEIDPENTEVGAQIRHLNEGGYGIVYRIPTSADILAISSESSADLDPEHTLLQRCVMHIQSNGEENGAPAVVDALPEAVVAAISQDMAVADPQAEIELALACPSCGHAWLALFDIVAFLWSEIHAWAQRTLHDVHLLARAYGWCEHDILAMSPTRRQIYLEMAQS